MGTLRKLAVTSEIAKGFRNPLRDEPETEANLTGVFVPSNRTNLPVWAELLFRED